MEVRYTKLAKARVKKLTEYNAKFPDEQLYRIVFVIDELADLMHSVGLAAPSIEPQSEVHVRNRKTASRGSKTGSPLHYGPPDHARTLNLYLLGGS